MFTPFFFLTLHHCSIYLIRHMFFIVEMTLNWNNMFKVFEQAWQQFFLIIFPSTQKTSDLLNTETASKPMEFTSPSQENHPTDVSCLHPATSIDQSTITSFMSLSDPHMLNVDSLQLNQSSTQTQDLLLPPSAFMTTGTQVMVIISFWLWHISIRAEC